MTSNEELQKLVKRAREAGATVIVTHDAKALAEEGRQIISSVKVIGMKGCGPYPMPALAAAERLRELFALDDGDAAEAEQEAAERKALIAADIEASAERCRAETAAFEAAGGFQQIPVGGRVALSHRIDHIAAGDYWDEGALREALAQPGIPAELAAACRRSLKGLERSTDHIRLCEVAIWLRETPSAPTEAFDDKAPKAGDKYRYYGRDFTVLASFPETLEGTRAANAYMAANPNAGVLNIDSGRVILADNSDKGV